MTWTNWDPLKEVIVGNCFPGASNNKLAKIQSLCYGVIVNTKQICQNQLLPQMATK